ncbi:hypothetical protein AAVH_22106 [Aphelenchoides avenae]|nr:hypothetical protein AAVH_22106 [Aphelenchus avenae]
MLSACCMILPLFLLAQQYIDLSAEIHHEVGIISYEPPYIHDLVEGVKTTFNITLSFSDRQPLSELSEPTWILEIESLHDKVATTDRRTAQILPNDFEFLEDGDWKAKVRKAINLTNAAFSG